MTLVQQPMIFTAFDDGVSVCVIVEFSIDNDVRYEWDRVIEINFTSYKTFIFHQVNVLNYDLRMSCINIDNNTSGTKFIIC